MRCGNSHRVPSWLASLIVASLAASTAGCAVGSVGTLAAHVQQRDTVTVMSIYSVGVHLRTREDDPGAHAGYSKRTYTFAADAALLPGWYFLRVPSPDRKSVAQDLMTLGIECALQAPEASITIGYAHTRLLARVPVNASVLIEYLDANLHVGKLTICSEESACTTF